MKPSSNIVKLYDLVRKQWYSFSIFPEKNSKLTISYIGILLTKIKFGRSIQGKYISCNMLENKIAKQLLKASYLVFSGTMS